MSARVVVAYATVKLLDPATGKATVKGFYRDAILPDYAEADNVASLVRRGYAEWVDEPTAEPSAAEPPAEPPAEPAEEPKPRKAAAKPAD